MLALASTVLACVLAFPAEAPPAPNPTRTHATTRNVAILLYPGVELLDFAGPTEVFSAAGANAFNVYTVAATAGPLESMGIVQITPQYTFATCPQPDIIVVPGGGTWGLNQAPIIEWIKTTSATNEINMSVCTGAFFLADAGLLDGRTVTTHYSGVRSMREKYPSVTVDENARYVDSGNVVTSAGVSAGIDGALHVVDRLIGRKAAENTARYMMYRWQPDGPAVEPTSDARRALEAWHGRDSAGAAAAYADYLKTNPDDAIALWRLGVALSRLGRNEDALAPLRRAVALGHTAARGDVAYALLALDKFEEARVELEAIAKANASPRDLYNLACARARCGDREAALEALDQAMAAGFMISSQRLENDDDLTSIRSEPRFKAHVARIGS